MDLLLSLSSDHWATLQRHVRAVMHELEPPELTPRLVQLRALPAGRLVGGRARRDLSEALAQGGALWTAAVGALRHDPAAGELVEVLRGSEQPEPAPAPPPQGDVAPDAASDALRRRVREVLEERDDARRRFEGAEARARAAGERVAAGTAELDAANARIAELEDELRSADERHRQAVDRERRRAQSEIDALTDELRRHRRLAEERRARSRRRAEQDAAEPTSPPPTPPRRTPPRTPPDPATLRAGTTEHAQAHLRRDRRVIVDGYNVTRQHRGDVPLADQRAWLVKLLEQAVSRYGIRATVVFDAEEALPPGSTAPSRIVTVVFASRTATADDEIVFEVEAAEDVLVITDDRELRERVGAAGGDSVGTLPFLSAVQ
ncbi:MAG: NYN domain-containing protein [Actinobacteria bacterium]|nr:NYN domain-containing protein [Actinomycetota bacterium]